MNARKPRWTDEDDGFLRLHSNWPTDELSKALMRTPAAVASRFQRLGMRRRYVCRWRFCRICGARRYDQCDRALCETHYLEYCREKSKESYRRNKQVGQRKQVRV